LHTFLDGIVHSKNKKWLYKPFNSLGNFSKTAFSQRKSNF
jgi:hypothetical protein